MPSTASTGPNRLVSAVVRITLVMAGLQAGPRFASSPGRVDEGAAGDRAGDQPAGVVGLGVAQQQPQRRSLDQRPGRAGWRTPGRPASSERTRSAVRSPQRDRQQHGRAAAVDADGPRSHPGGRRPRGQPGQRRRRRSGSRSGRPLDAMSTTLSWRSSASCGGTNVTSPGRRPAAGEVQEAAGAARASGRLVRRGRPAAGCRTPGVDVHVHVGDRGLLVDRPAAAGRARRGRPPSEPATGASSAGRAPASTRRASSGGSRSAVSGSRTGTSGTTVARLDS